eukprot:gene4093-8140_t
MVDESTWQCIPCGMVNRADAAACVRCYTEKTSALEKGRRKRMCEECGHRHTQSTCCHVLVEIDSLGDALGSDDDVSEDSESVDDDDLLSENDSDEESTNKKKKTGFGIVMTAATTAHKAEKKKLLQTPEWARRIGYARCNCREGVPVRGTRFEPVPKIMNVGNIRVLQYDDLINAPFDRRKSSLTGAEDEATMLQKQQEKNQMQMELLPKILSYLPLCHISPAAIVSQSWNRGSNSYNEYKDVRDCIPWNVFRPHTGITDAILLSDKRIFSGGDKRLIASDIYTGEVLQMLARDTANITQLMAFNANLICCSSNGSIRFLPFNHDIRRMKQEHAVWEHHGSIKRMVLSTSIAGVCDKHGMENHSCLLYTASEDRRIGVWDSTNGHLVTMIDNHSIRKHTYQSLTQSDYHLIAGTSGGLIMIFSKFNYCEREDTHACSAIGADKTHCLQVCLRLPQNKSISGHSPSVLALHCTGPHYARSTLWAGDSIGQLTIWDVPKSGLDYAPRRTSRTHGSAIRCIESTWKHAITAGDDGKLILHDLISLARIRTIDVTQVTFDKQLINNPEIPRYIKSLQIVENFETGGSMCIGTSFGEVMISSIGMYM